MSGDVGLARLPRTLGARLEEAAANLAVAANDLDGLLTHSSAALEALEGRHREARRIRHDVRVGALAARRPGADRLEAVALADAATAVIERLSDVAWSWSHLPVDGAWEPVAALRDCVRACGRGLAAHEDAPGLLAHAERCEAQEDDVRRWIRRARAELIADGGDERVALRAEGLLDEIEHALRACVGLRVALLRRALA
jgi:hypothetical protein